MNMCTLTIAYSHYTFNMYYRPVCKKYVLKSKSKSKNRFNFNLILSFDFLRILDFLFP